MTSNSSTAIGGVAAPHEIATTTIACEDCGVEVTEPQAASWWVEPIEKQVSFGGLIHAQPANVRIRMSRCGTCRARRARAEAVLDRRPMLAHSLGSRTYGDARVDTALIVADILGLALDLENADIRVLRLAMRHLSPAGAAARWLGWFVPTIQLGAKPGTAAPTRWGHLTSEVRGAVQDAYAGYLRALTFSSAEVPPPEAGQMHAAMRGCLLCGIQAVTIHERDAMPWGSIYSADPATLGGKGSPDRLWGFVCPTCRASMERHGTQALGAYARDWALADYLGVDGIPDAYESVALADVQRLAFLRLLKAWAVTGREPNTTPWAHLGDLEAVKDLLKQF